MNVKDEREMRAARRMAMGVATLADTTSLLTHIATPDQPEPEYGGFHDTTIHAARSALHHLVKLHTALHRLTTKAAADGCPREMIDGCAVKCAVTDGQVYGGAVCRACWRRAVGIEEPRDGVEIVKERKDGEMSCECLTWATLDVRHQLLTGHHERCPHRPDALTAALELIAEMAHGMELWAADEDGIHPDAWKSYIQAKALEGVFLPEEPN